MSEINNKHLARVYDIRCPNCNGAASYDIRKHRYNCGYCGSSVSVSEALKQREGFKQLQHKKITDSIRNYHLESIDCPSCGAQLVFEKDEALSKCPFCETSLVRKEYVKAKNIPEAIIGFRITLAEAKAILKKWCNNNSGKKEAQILIKHLDELQGYYLPYEFLRGPINCGVSRIDGGRTYHCSAYVDEAFVNSSSQFDNLLLDAMEPYDLKDMDAFDFGYVAGQRVKVDNVAINELNTRIRQETAEVYRPILSKTLESKALDISTDTSNLMEMPVLLPAYYLNIEGVHAAINGQTGKIAVRSIRPSYYYFLPWWLKAIVSTILITSIVYLGLRLFGMNSGSSIYLSGILMFFFLIVTLCAYSDTIHNDFKVEKVHKIFTDDTVYKRVNNELVIKDKKVQKKVADPIFYETLDGKTTEVTLRFSSPLRMIRMISMAMAVLFLPVIIALFLRGFDFSKIDISGSAVWFCIFVPVIPIYLLKFGRIEIYDDPWIYVTDENGKKKRYRLRKKISKEDRIFTLKMILRALFVPPGCFATWFAIASFLVIVYLTAGGQ